MPTSDNWLIITTVLLSLAAAVFSFWAVLGRITHDDFSELLRVIKQWRENASSRQVPNPNDPSISLHLRDLKKDIGNISNQIEDLAMELKRLRSSLELKSSPPPSPSLRLEPIAETPKKTFEEELLECYNEFSAEEFRSRFAPKAAQLSIPSSLQSHPAGSFWMVESPAQKWFCLPRPHKITTNLYEDTGLKHLFDCQGYNPSGPDCAFLAEQPALASPAADSWSLKRKGLLVVKPEET
jgi:hypothetical protein